MSELRFIWLLKIDYCCSLSLLNEKIPGSLVHEIYFKYHNNINLLLELVYELCVGVYFPRNIIYGKIRIVMCILSAFVQHNRLQIIR